MQSYFVQCVQNENKEVSAIDTIRAIKEAGFDGVFIQWYDKKWDFSQEEQLKLCRDLGLNIVFAHLGYSGINDIWVEGENGDNLVKKYLRNLDECKANGISMVCMHLTSKSVVPEPNQLGVKRIQIIVNYAEKLGIKVAFENTKIFGYLEYVFDRIKNKNVGICLDVGHYHCHFKDNFSWERFKNRIFAVHLHDNDQTDDLHLLPFDGTIDWEDFITKLQMANYNGPVILESCYRYDYINMPLLDFYKLSLERAKEIYKISKLST